jgi:RNA ligase (TIGR02306 family)
MLRSRFPKTPKGWFFYLLFLIGFRGARKRYAQEVSFHLPTYDVDALKNYPSDFVDGEPVLVTEKIHGSNARFIFLDGTMYAGSRTQWKAPGSNDVWHRALKDNPWIEDWCRLHEGYALYGEVAPTQKGFNYGSTGEIRFFVFDIRTSDDEWLPFSLYQELYLNDRPFWDYSSDFLVPILYSGPFDLKTIMSLVDGPSQVKGAKHLREGVVVKKISDLAPGSRHRHRQLKIVSNAFLEKDSK